MTQAQARQVAHRLTEQTGNVVVPCSRDTWHGHHEVTPEWGVVMHFHFYLHITDLPKALQAVAAKKD